MTQINDPASNLAAVRADIAKAATAAGRDAADVHLIAVSKFHEADTILPVLHAGHRLFGENRVQEAETKWPPLREQFADITLHLIGPLQSNKVKNAVAVFDVIETVDRAKIARALAGEFERTGRSLPCYVQVNTGEEPQKAGVAPGDVDAFVKDCRENLGLDIRGLMCIPPADVEPAPYFALLAKLAREVGLTGLSMGMSSDYPTAVTIGATHIRVGSALFDARGGAAA